MNLTKRKRIRKNIENYFAPFLKSVFIQMTVIFYAWCSLDTALDQSETANKKLSSQLQSESSMELTREKYEFHIPRDLYVWIVFLEMF